MDVASRLRGALGDDIQHLVKVIPRLNNLLGEHHYDNKEDQDCLAAQGRLQVGLIGLHTMRLILAFFHLPYVLLLLTIHLSPVPDVSLRGGHFLLLPGCHHSLP